MSLLPPPRELLLFMTAAIVLLVIPGPAVLYIVARSVDQGRAAGLAACSGIATG
jgi:threonine/homoserine/homoserine lactone efflux protein